MPEPSTVPFDLRHLDAGFYADPYPVYRALREHEPVKRLPDGGVLLTRWADCVQVYKNAALFASDKTREFRPKYGDSLLYEHHTTSLVFNDPPRHTRVRRLIAGALTPKAIAAMEPALAALVDRLIVAMGEKHATAAGRPVDLIADFASAIPIEVIGNLLGVPQADRGPLRGWSLAILGALEPVVTPAAFEWGNRSLREFIAYLEGLIADRRAHPGDYDRDVLTRLIEGEREGEFAGEMLSAPELLHNCIFLLNAGHETTTNLIGNALVALAQHPGERRRLIDEPGLLRTAVEEVLRYESSNQLGNRITTAAAEVGGVALAPGTSITLCIGAANRDPEQFADPERFDIARSPNRHLAFGSGIHQCAGMGLARLEGAIAVGRFLTRFPRYRLSGAPERGARARFRGFTAAPCILEP
ncbi:MAG: cytochrome P450 [Burkholderiales bacterium]|nr:cytochrome P450 [Burkholderiales bacterium]